MEGVWGVVQLWVHQPGGHSAEALQWLTNFPAVVQGLVQVRPHSTFLLLHLMVVMSVHASVYVTAS